MKTYLQAYDLWEVVEMDKDPPPLRANPTLSQMRQHNEECAKKHKPCLALRTEPDIQCRSCKQLGHMETVCKNEFQQQQSAQAQAADGNQPEEEQMFVASCNATNNQAKVSWLIDSGCTNHMAADEDMFKKNDRTCTSEIRLGNGSCIQAKGK
ncbi:hypothetical protein GQ457_09G030970 [Hibiscus cannabinus]